MIKVIVIERCGDCPYMKWDGKACVCSKLNKEINPFSSDFVKFEAGSGMPNWCPLPDLPQRKPEMEYLAVGYNKCLDDILEKEG